MGRDWWGYDKTVPADQLYPRNRGRWKLNRLRASREDYVLYSHNGTVKYVIEIHDTEQFRDNRIGFIGEVLPADHPVARRWVDKPAPDSNRNPVSYYYEPGDSRTCRCGCGDPVSPDRAFAPGHDQRAIHDRITERWGDAVKFITWYDATFRSNPESATS
jgi:hypothetical protein